MTRSVALVFGLSLAGFGALAACDDYGTTSNTSPSSTTTTVATTTTTALPVALQPTAQDAATVFVDAWVNGDQATALSVAVADAVNAVWATPPGSTQNRGCNEPTPGSPVRCVYRTDAGELIVQATETQGAGWYVSFASLSPPE